MRGRTNTTRALARLLACTALAVALLTVPAQARSWRFAPSVSAQDRAIFRAALDSFDPGMRALFAEVAPYTTVATHRGATSLGGTSGLRRRPYLVDYATAHLHDRSYARHAIAHELGHVLDDAGVGPRRMREFVAAARRSARWRSCFVMRGGGCVTRRELFAEQVAYAATGGLRVPTGYHDPPLVTTGRMLEVLAGFRPFG